MLLDQASVAQAVSGKCVRNASHGAGFVPWRFVYNYVNNGSRMSLAQGSHSAMGQRLCESKQWGNYDFDQQWGRGGRIGFAWRLRENSAPNSTSHIKRAGRGRGLVHGLALLRAIPHRSTLTIWVPFSALSRLSMPATWVHCAGG